MSVLSAPVTPAPRRLGRSGGHVEDCNYLLDYFRLTVDNRLLYGGGVTYGGKNPPNIDSVILPKLNRTFPQLKGVKIDYRWDGNTRCSAGRNN